MSTARGPRVPHYASVSPGTLRPLSPWLPAPHFQRACIVAWPLLGSQRRRRGAGRAKKAEAGRGGGGAEAGAGGSSGGAGAEFLPSQRPTTGGGQPLARGPGTAPSALLSLAAPGSSSLHPPEWKCLQAKVHLVSCWRPEVRQKNCWGKEYPRA